VAQGAIAAIDYILGGDPDHDPDSGIFKEFLFTITNSIDSQE